MYKFVSKQVTNSGQYGSFFKIRMLAETLQLIAFIIVLSWS